MTHKLKIADSEIYENEFNTDLNEALEDLGISDDEFRQNLSDKLSETLFTNLLKKYSNAQIKIEQSVVAKL